MAKTKTTPELDILFGTSGIKRGNRRTKPNTFTEADPSSLTKEQVDNRDCTGWPTGQHIVLTGKCSGSTLQKILRNWIGLTSKDAEQPSTQLLYIPQADGSVSNVIYNRYNAAGEDWGTGTLQELLAQNVLPSTGVVAEQVDANLAAIRTKPFILLAGISGTGKSRLVRQLARGCCPKLKAGGGNHPLCDEGRPGNFEMIQVRPNWHDSTELMGYVSRIVKAGDPPKYVMMPFVEFLAKAWVYREVPFFLCLDEMNLAPVEQYFAEYLSVIETRKKRILGPDGATFEAISTDPLVRWENIEQDTLMNAVKDLFEDKDWAAKAEHGRVEEIEKLILHDKGIRIPPNLVVMGTVNMDETTCTFSRKVLDRAMSFELNDVADMYDPAKLGADAECEFGAIPATAAESKLLTGKEAYDSTAGQIVAIAANGTKVGDAILKILEVLNEKEVPAKKDDGSDDGGTMSLLAKTPFKIAYRTRNEIMIYCVERIGNGLVALPQALDEAISMKILSRIEGDSQHVQKKWLVTLSAAIESELSKLDGYDAAKCTLCKSKLADMAEQADYGYTSFWTR